MTKESQPQPQSRLSIVKSHFLDSATSPRSTDMAKNWDNLPTFDELPNLQNYTGCAWDVWGKGDQLGTINMLTDEVVTEAAKEIKYVSYEIFNSHARHLVVL